MSLRRPLDGQRVHFVGIGGVGMAALAELLMDMGYEVSGSDLRASVTTRRLDALGADVRIGAHRAEHVEGAEHVVVSAAIRTNNPEVVRARELGSHIVSRADLLGLIFRAGRGVAVSGTHGKTTTSSMLARALDGAGFHPSFIIGGDLNDVGSGAHLGTSDIVVAEADEAYGSFLALTPELVVITSVDLDHLDHYGDQAAIDDAFVRFCSQRRDGGAAIVNADDEGVRRILERIEEPVVTYGSGGDLAIDGRELVWHGEPIGPLELAVPGRHNVENAMGAAAAALTLGADPEPVLASLRAFGGVERRFSVRGEEAGVVVVDDYAHLPRKISASLNAAREAYAGRRVVVLFQPHLYSRTVQLADGLGSALGTADVVVVTDIYGDREDPIPGVSGRLVSDVVRTVADGTTTAVYVPRLEEAAGFVVGIAEPGDVVITMGAGDVTMAAPRILSLLAAERAT